MARIRPAVANPGRGRGARPEAAARAGHDAPIPLKVRPWAPNNKGNSHGAIAAPPIS